MGFDHEHFPTYYIQFKFAFSMLCKHMYWSKVSALSNLTIFMFAIPFLIHDLSQFVTRVTQLALPVEQELLSFRSTWVHPRYGCSIFNFLCMFCRSLFVRLTFFFHHCLVCPPRYTDSDYPFGIFKLL